MSKLLLLVGPNGSGKTKELENIFHNNGDDLTFFKNYFDKLKSHSYTYQSFTFPQISREVYYFLLTPLITARIPQKEAEEIVQFYLRHFDFEYLLKQNVTNLSGGELKILYIISCILLERERLIIDDPYGMLDKDRITMLNSMLSKDFDYKINKIFDKELILAIPDSHETETENIEATFPNTTKIFLKSNDQIRNNFNSFIEICENSFDLIHSNAPLEVNDLSIFLSLQKKQIFNNFNCIFDNQVLNIVRGSNGSGKSLLLKALVGKLPKKVRLSNGVIKCNSITYYPRTGYKKTGNRERNWINDNILFIPQDIHYYKLTDNSWDIFCRVAKGYDDILKAGKKYLLGKLLFNRPLIETSIGQKKFSILLIAFLHSLLNSSIKWIVLDEPDSNLDLERQQILNQLVNKALQYGRGLLITSHKDNIYANKNILNL